MPLIDLSVRYALSKNNLTDLIVAKLADCERAKKAYNDALMRYIKARSEAEALDWIRFHMDELLEEALNSLDESTAPSEPAPINRDEQAAD